MNLRWSLIIANAMERTDFMEQWIAIILKVQRLEHIFKEKLSCSAVRRNIFFSMIQYVVCSLNSFYLKGKYFFFTLHAYIYVPVWSLFKNQFTHTKSKRQVKWKYIQRYSSIDHAWLKIHFLPNKYDPDCKVHSWDMLYTNICNLVEWTKSSHFTVIKFRCQGDLQ